MSDAPGTEPALDPTEGRDLYGQDPESYALGRPDYPVQVYELLASRCALAPASRVVEIGPGTGLVTRHLLDAGASVTAVEPNAAMAQHLVQSIPEARLDVVVDAFEDAPLPDDGFDLAVAATSFHWVAAPRGMQQLRRIVRPGGWVAIWWMLHDDPAAPDALSALVERLVAEQPGSVPVVDPAPFQLDERARCGELSAAGFVDVDREIISSAIELDAVKARALYASMAVVIRLGAEHRTRLLDTVEAFVRELPHGRIRRQVPTAFYTARNPS